MNTLPGVDHDVFVSRGARVRITVQGTTALESEDASVLVDDLEVEVLNVVPPMRRLDLFDEGQCHEPLLTIPPGVRDIVRENSIRETPEDVLIVDLQFEADGASLAIDRVFRMRASPAHELEGFPPATFDDRSDLYIIWIDVDNSSCWCVYMAHLHVLVNGERHRVFIGAYAVTGDRNLDFVDEP